jgi:CrcB protein
MKIALIAFGSALGGVARYLLAGFVQRIASGTFPVGTMAVNVTGCLLIGVLAALFAGPHLVREELRFALMVGLLGGFTTFSTFGFETFALFNDGEFGLALLNVVATNAACLVGVWLGYRLVERWLGA